MFVDEDKLVFGDNTEIEVEASEGMNLESVGKSEEKTSEERTISEKSEEERKGDRKDKRKSKGNGTVGLLSDC